MKVTKSQCEGTQTLWEDTNHVKAYKVIVRAYIFRMSYRVILKAYKVIVRAYILRISHRVILSITICHYGHHIEPL